MTSQPTRQLRIAKKDVVIEILLAIALGYIAVLLVLELVIWRVQPDMEGGVTLHVHMDGAIVERKLYGLEHNSALYVSSNHWFRKWYHAVLASPNLDVERAGQLGPYTATQIEGSELAEVTRAYNQGFMLRLLCGFAPQRFLRLDPRVDDK